MAIDEKILNDRLNVFNGMSSDEQMDLKRSLFEHILGMNIKTDIDGTSDATPEAMNTIRSFFAGKDPSNPAAGPAGISDNSMKALIGAYEAQGVDITMPRDQLRQTFEDKFKDPMFIINVRKDVFAHGEDFGKDISEWVGVPGLAQDERDRREYLFETFVDTAVQRGREDKYTEKDITAARDIFSRINDDSIDASRFQLDPAIERERAQGLLMGIMCVRDTDANGNPLFENGGVYEQLLKEVEGHSEMLVQVVAPFANGQDVTKLSNESTTFVRGRDMLSDYLAQGMDPNWTEDQRSQYLTNRCADLFNISEESASLIVGNVRPRSHEENGILLSLGGFTREAVGDRTFEKVCDGFTLGPFEHWAKSVGFGEDFKGAFSHLISLETERLKGRRHENLIEKLFIDRETGKPIPELQEFFTKKTEDYKADMKIKSTADRLKKYKLDAVREAPGYWDGVKGKEHVMSICKSIPELVDNPDKAIVAIFSEFMDLVLVEPLESLAARQEKIAKSFGNSIQKYEDEEDERIKGDLEAYDKSLAEVADRDEKHGSPRDMKLDTFADNIAKHSGGKANGHNNGRPVEVNMITQEPALEQEKGVTLLNDKEKTQLDKIIQMKQLRGQPLSPDQVQRVQELAGELKKVGVLGKALDLAGERNKLVGRQ